MRYSPLSLKLLRVLKRVRRLRSWFSTFFSVSIVIVRTVWTLVYWLLFLRIYLKLKVRVESCKLREVLSHTSIPESLQDDISSLYVDGMMEIIDTVLREVSKSLGKLSVFKPSRFKASSQRFL